jgi:hypothetical protein
LAFSGSSFVDGARGAVVLRTAALGLLVLSASACRDLSGFSTAKGDHFQGVVVNADFVLAGVGPYVQMCLTVDTDHLQDAPGAIWTDDGRFNATPLRPIPQIWHDPLSTLSFGEGRIKNLVYVATTSPGDGGAGDDVFVIESLMQSGAIEVRLLRGAPAISVDGGVPSSSGGNIFAVFNLDRKEGACSF